jgi:anti-sigma-K factor RskA
MNYLLPDRLDRLAREYALGTLAGPARRRSERLLRQTPAAMLAVGAWQERLASLASTVPAMQPSESVWRALEHRLFISSARAASAPIRPPQWLRGLLSGRALGGALAGVFLCALLLRLQPGLIGMEPEMDVLPASYVGLLTDTAGAPTVLASSKRHGKRLTVKLLQPVVIPAGSVAQLWALPKDGSAAFPVGVVPGTGSATVALADTSEKLFFNVSRLAVSIEVTPAKAGDKPSGDFVLSGHCVKLW